MVDTKAELGMDSGSLQELMAGSCEHGSGKGREFIYWLSYYQLLNKTSWN
jgi:hypothetical protein